ncbi:MAG: sigma-70 family RNA polymerase sigma factor [Clostridiales bacterium]|nr:sigma-70 family RNA polymerase sigma factor [Clostridiales bacterium]
MKKHGIVLVDLETLSETLGAEDEDFETVLCQHIEVSGLQIPVYNQELAIALLELTDMQRSILLQNVVLNITLKKIACELKISERMARKHKHNAIESIRRRMKRR